MIILLQLNTLNTFHIYQTEKNADLLASLSPNVSKKFLLEKVGNKRAHTQGLFMGNSHGYKYMHIAYIYTSVLSVIILHIISKLSRKLFPKNNFKNHP